MSAEVQELCAGMQVQVLRVSDSWMLGDVFGEIVKVGRLVHVRMTRSGQVRKVTVDRVIQRGR